MSSSVLAYCANTFAGANPHKGLKELYSDEETIKFVDSIWKLRVDSPDPMYSYTMGRNAGVRSGCSRKIVLCDLKLTYGFGPERRAPCNATLMTVIRKGALHKDRHSVDQQVDMQPHRDYRMCAVFATVVLVVLKLRALDSDIKFLAGAYRQAGKSV